MQVFRKMQFLSGDREEDHTLLGGEGRTGYTRRGVWAGIPLSILMVKVGSRSSDRGLSLRPYRRRPIRDILPLPVSRAFTNPQRLRGTARGRRGIQGLPLKPDSGNLGMGY
jgi:hypothetical protein